MVLVLIGLAVVMYIGWAYIHELAHLITAKKMVGVKDYTIVPWPHLYNGRWYWARFHHNYEKVPTAREQAWISFAPRYMNLVATVLFPLGTFMPGWWFWVWTVVWGAGLVDFWSGSTGINKYHDLRRYAAGWDISPYLFRIGGFVLIVASVAIWVWGY